MQSSRKTVQFCDSKLIRLDGETIHTSSSRAVINFDGQEFGRKYDSVYFPMNVGGKLAYVALKAGKKFIVYDGMEAPNYNEVYEPLIFGGKIAHLAELNGSGIFVYDGIIKANYSRVDPQSLKEIDGKLAFRAADDDKPKGRYFVVYDGTEIGKGFDNVLAFTASGAKQAYLAEKNASRYVVYDGHAIQHGYNYIDPASLSFHNGKLSFVAQKSGKWYIIREE